MLKNIALATVTLLVLIIGMVTFDKLLKDSMPHQTIFVTIAHVPNYETCQAIQKEFKADLISWEYDIMKLKTTSKSLETLVIHLPSSYQVISRIGNNNVTLYHRE
jgi:hypothetical protein